MSAAAALPSPRKRGRPPSCTREVAVRIIAMRRQGLTLVQICIVLNAHGVPTPTGRRFGRSHTSTDCCTRGTRKTSSTRAPPAVLAHNRAGASEQGHARV